MKNVLAIFILVAQIFYGATLLASSFEYIKRAAEQGEPTAQDNLGVMYYNGQGVCQDYEKARQWFEKAAKQGLAAAQFNLGTMYDNGYGVQQNLTIAKELFGKACYNGLQEGCDVYNRLNEMGY